MSAKTKLERDFQAHLIKNLKQLYPGCIILKNDSSYLQGVPDLLILYKDRWAALEVKASASANVQPNQEFYVDYMNDMSFASFIHPENEEEVLYGLEQTFRDRRTTRVSLRE